MSRALVVSPVALLAGVLILLALAPAGAAAKRCPGADTTPSKTTVARAQVATLCLVNNERERRGLRALRADAALVDAAAGHSTDMVRRKYFGHTSPGGSGSASRARAAGYRSSFVGENIAWGASTYAKPRAIVRLWMGSSVHRANILRRWNRDAGAGVADGLPVRRGEVPFDPAETGGSTFTMVFGAR